MTYLPAPCLVASQFIVCVCVWSIVFEILQTCVWIRSLGLGICTRPTFVSYFYGSVVVMELSLIQRTVLHEWKIICVIMNMTSSNHIPLRSFLILSSLWQVRLAYPQCTLYVPLNRHFSLIYHIVQNSKFWKSLWNFSILQVLPLS